MTETICNDACYMSSLYGREPMALPLISVPMLASCATLYLSVHHHWCWQCLYLLRKQSEVDYVCCVIHNYATLRNF